MAEDQSNAKEDGFDFTREGEAPGYISLEQARIMAMRTTREMPGAYGLRWTRSVGQEWGDIKRGSRRSFVVYQCSAW